MALKEHCGNKCNRCKKPCGLDSKIPCSPDCENLTKDGNIKIRECLKANCDEIRYIFDMVNATDDEFIRKYGEETSYPYDV